MRELAIGPVDCRNSDIIDHEEGGLRVLDTYSVLGPIDGTSAKEGSILTVGTPEGSPVGWADG